MSSPTIPEIIRTEHDGDSGAKKITDVNTATNVQVDSGDANIEYVGRAPIGSATSDPVWQIKRVDSTTGTIILWADGNDLFDNDFSAREGLIYS